MKKWHQQPKSSINNIIAQKRGQENTNEEKVEENKGKA